MVNKRKIAMKDIGYADVESYVRTLVSEGLGQQIEDTERSVGHFDDDCRLYRYADSNLSTYNHDKRRQLGLLPSASTLSGNAHTDASGHA